MNPLYAISNLHPLKRKDGVPLDTCRGFAENQYMVGQLELNNGLSEPSQHLILLKG